jgi:hypothetical protein
MARENILQVLVPVLGASVGRGRSRDAALRSLFSEKICGGFTTAQPCQGQRNSSLDREQLALEDT